MVAGVLGGLIRLGLGGWWGYCMNPGPEMGGDHDRVSPDSQGDDRHKDDQTRAEPFQGLHRHRCKY